MQGPIARGLLTGGPQQAVTDLGKAGDGIADEEERKPQKEEGEVVSPHHGTGEAARKRRHLSLSSLPVADEVHKEGGVIAVVWG